MEVEGIIESSNQKKEYESNQGPVSEGLQEGNCGSGSRMGIHSFMSQYRGEKSHFTAQTMLTYGRDDREESRARNHHQRAQ